MGLETFQLEIFHHRKKVLNLRTRSPYDGIRAVVINMEHAAFDQGLAQALAEHLKAPCYSLSELKAENLYNAVKKEMNAGYLTFNA